MKVFSVFTVVRIYFLLVFKCLAIVPWSRTTLWQLVCISDYQKTISMTLRIIRATTRPISVTPVHLYIISAMAVLSVWHYTSSELRQDLSVWHPYIYTSLVPCQYCQYDTMHHQSYDKTYQCHTRTCHTINALTILSVWHLRIIRAMINQRDGDSWFRSLAVLLTVYFLVTAAIM